MAYIVKPFTDRELYGTIEVAMHRYQLHTELRQREERYRMLSEVLSDFAFCITIASEPVDDHVEWTAGNLNNVLRVGVQSIKSVEDLFLLVAPEDGKALRAVWDGFHTGESGAIEFRIVNASGHTEWIKLDGRVRTDVDGRRTLFGALKNVTALRTTEQRLEEREFEFSQIVQTVRQGIWVGDSDNVCIYANAALCDMTGYTREEIVGSNSLASLLGVPEAEHAENVAGPTAQESAPSPFELQLRTASGEDLVVLVTRRVICDPTGTLRGSFSLVVDVTRQRHALDVVQRSARKLEEVFHASPVPSLLIDAASNAVLDVNESFIIITGYEREEVIGKGGFGLAQYEDLEDLNRMVALLKERVPESAALRLRKKDGSVAAFEAQVREIVVDEEVLQLLILTPKQL
jgi:PAS domain S-box-containing protein